MKKNASNLLLKTKHDFRGTNWGMNKTQVKATEKKKPYIEDNNILSYQIEVDGKDFACVYWFLKNKLYGSGYLIKEIHTNKNDYINNYGELKESLTKKYGKPKMNKVIWKNNLYKGNEQNWGLAISMGHLVYRTQWETYTTVTSLDLIGDNSDIAFGIRYDSKELKEWAKQIEEKKTLKSL